MKKLSKPQFFCKNKRGSKKRELLIPKTFHRIWLGPKPLPGEFVKYGETWLHYHPDWTMNTWNEANMIPLINQEEYNNTASVVKKSDIARPELIYKFGGVYIDCDFECLKNIESLIKGLEAFSASEDSKIVYIGIMGCVPNSPFFKQIIDRLPDSISKNSHLDLVNQTGPIYYTEVFKECEGIKIFGPELFYPYLYTEKHRKGEAFPNAYAVHHWAGSWVEND
jgi:mannosyltransferase OCH1-like enzyme